MILLDEILSHGLLIIPALMLSIDLSFLLGSFKLKQSGKLSLNFKKKLKKINLSSIKRKTLTIIGWIYMVNTRPWSFKFKGSSVLGMVKSY